MAKKSKKILVTGGAGFIGSEFVRQGVAKGYQMTVVDKLTYAGDLTRLKSVQKKINFYKTDICDTASLQRIVKKHRPESIVHFAAETHVDRSIQDVRPFIKTNVEGTNALIQIARQFQIPRFIHIATDEVYGEIHRGKFTETSPIQPNNPYSATKAAADFLIKAAIRTYKLPAIIIRPSNNYGYWQYPEKFIPVIILKAMRHQPIPVYGEGKNVREWLHVSDCARAVSLVLEKGKIGEIYNIGSDIERQNIQVVKAALRLLNKPLSLIQFVQDRPGHDFRYSLSCKKVHDLGWRPQVNFETGLSHTLAWAQDNFDWLEGKLTFLQQYWKKVYKPNR